MIKVTAGELFLSQAALTELVGERLPNKTAFQIRRVLKRIDPEVKSFDEQRLEIAKRFGTETEQGTFTVSADKLAEFNAELKVVADHELEFADLETISPDALGTAEVKTAALFQLAWLIPDA